MGAFFCPSLDSLQELTASSKKQTLGSSVRPSPTASSISVGQCTGAALRHDPRLHTITSNRHPAIPAR